MNTKSLGLLLAALLWLCGVNPPVVQACVGAGPWQETLDSFLKGYDALVVGQYVDIDAANANGIFRVDEYWSGSGPQYLLMHNTPRHQLSNEHGHWRPPSGCSSGERPVLGTGIYVYSVARDVTGQYHPGRQWFVFEDAQSLGQARFENSESLPLSLDVLRARVDARTGGRPQPPDAQAPYPRTTPILLVTEDGQSFLLPVDSLTPVPVPADQRPHLLQRQHTCDAPPCVVYSPNGMDSLTLNAPGKIPLPAQRPEVYRQHHWVLGQRVGIAPTSDVYALWQRDTIQVYALWYPRNGYTLSRQDYRKPIAPQRINVTNTADSLRYPFVWHPDGRALAFSTADGLWLWDALTRDAQPRLLLPADAQGVPTAHAFSPGGRYLGITIGAQRLTLDTTPTASGTYRLLPDGVVSPDDRLLLVTDTTNTTSPSLSLMGLAPDTFLLKYDNNTGFRDVRWLSQDTFAAVVTAPNHRRGVPRGVPEYDCISWRYATVDEPLAELHIFNRLAAISYADYVATGWSPREDLTRIRTSPVQARHYDYVRGPGLLQVDQDGRHVAINDQVLRLDHALPALVAEMYWLPSAYQHADDAMALPRPARVGNFCGG